LTASSMPEPSDEDAKKSASQQQKRVNGNDIVRRTQFSLPSFTGLEQQKEANSARKQEPILATPHPLVLRNELDKESQIETAIDPTTEPQLILTGHAEDKRENASTPRIRTKAFWFPFLLALLICLLVGAIFAFSYSYFIRSPQTKVTMVTPPKQGTANSVNITPQETGTTPPQSGLTSSIPVGTNPSLEIRGDSGNVTIHPGGSESMSIRASDQSIQLTQARDNQGHDKVTIVPKLSDARINYDITVPPTTRLTINIATGSISVNGVSSAIISTTDGNLDIENIYGAVQAVASRGNITLKNVTGSMMVRTLNGSIKGSMIQGTLNASTQHGDVTIQHTTLASQSILETMDGSIHFTGTCDPTGSCTMTTGNGNIILTLPTSGAFQLHTSTPAGVLMNAFGSTSIGSAPQAQISASTDNGSITVQKQSG
jgi:Putative adhesin